MPNVLVDGAVLRLTASAAWGWGTSTPSSPSFANYVDITITATGSNLTVDGKKTVLPQDIVNAVASYTDSYHASPNFGVFANVPPLTVGLDGTLLGVVIADAVGSSILKHGGIGVMLDDASGDFIATTTVPAVAPIPPPPVGAPVPDPVVPKPGTWAIQDNGQGTVKLTAAS